jgi:peptide deformylase
MPARPIVQLGDPLLREISRPFPDPAQARLVLRDLDATLDAFRCGHGFGRGISAVQIGEPLRAIYLEVAGIPYELVNPEFLSLSEETFTLWDDCFSFPNLMVRLKRSISLRLRYQSVSGEWQELEASGALSELIQHEMDHLDGVLAIDRALPGNSLATREEWVRRFAGA